MNRLVDRLKPALLSRFSETELAERASNFQRVRLKGERLLARPGAIRIAATACWSFPIYSQTFVYQELVQLVRHGFDLRFLYSELTSREQLPRQFDAVWNARRQLVLHYSVSERDLAYFYEKLPKKVAVLEERLCQASGLDRDALRNHYHYKQAFAFARMVEAYRPDYLHSYFFYEGTLFTYIASHLLDIPRGVSCYADHLLDDYVLKVVPLHLEQSSIVIATSHRIKRELLGLAPHVDPDKIAVKPNAIDSSRFPVDVRREPAPGAPYRLVSVNRIEPKKGVVYLVEAVRILRDRGIPVQLSLLGGVDESAAAKEYAQQVEDRIRALELGDAVRLEGRKSELEIRRFLADAQLFVAPFIETDTGDKDGIPTALLEAMATGIPVVATDAGSIAEVIEPECDGVMVNQRDAAALAAAIQALLADPERRSRLGAGAAEKIRRQFDVEVCERVFHDRIRQVTAQPVRSRE